MVSFLTVFPPMVKWGRCGTKWEKVVSYGPDGDLPQVA